MASVTDRARAYLHRNEFLRHVLTLMSGTLLAQVLTMGTALVLGRVFSAAELGLYNGVMSVAAFVIPLAAWRYDMAIVLPDSDADGRQMVRLATGLNTITSTVVTVVMLFFGGPIARAIDHPEARYWLLWCGPIVWSWAEFTILNYWANRRKNFKLVSHNAVINSVVTNVGQVSAGFAQWGVVGLLGATVLGEFAAVGHSARTVYSQVMTGREPEARSYRQLMREYRKMPLLNLPNAMVDQVRLQGINLMLLAMLSASDLGQFGMAWRLVQAPMASINTALNQVLLQRLSRARRGQMVRLVRSSMVRSALIGVGPFAIIYFLAPHLLPLVLSSDHDKWRPAGEVTAVLVPWLFLNFITQPISSVFVVVRRQGTMLAFAVVYAALPLGLIWWRHSNLLSTMRWVSWGMAALLVLFLFLTLHVARRFDTGVPWDAEEASEVRDDIEVLDAEQEVNSPEVDHDTIDDQQAPGTH